VFYKVLGLAKSDCLAYFCRFLKKEKKLLPKFLQEPGKTELLFN